MKKIIFAFAVLLSMAACKQNKPTQAVENETETTALTEAVDSINQQTRKRCGPAFLENMKEVQAYLKECGAFFIATVDGDQPHVRAFGVSEIINDRLYIMTGKVNDDDLAVKEEFLNRNEGLKSIYKADDDNMAIHKTHKETLK